MNNLLNRTLKRYRMEILLGSGGMGSVYKALDISLNREVAVKIMHPQYAADANFRQRFLQEARVAANLDHPGVVKVYDFDEYQGVLFIVMEFISGMNLSQWLDKERAAGCWISLGDAVEMVRQVALALQHAHECGVLHRDIKPANIMIKNQPADRLAYRPVITDLGLAKLVEGMQITRDGDSMGTPAYMSPEQAIGSELDARSDVYSLGVLLYQLTVGQLPFSAKTISEAIRDHTQKAPPQPIKIQPDFPVHLERLILKSLEKDPAKRFQSAGMLSKALGDFLKGTPDRVARSTMIRNVNPQDLGTIFFTPADSGRRESIFADFDRTPAGVSGSVIQVHAPRQADCSYPLRQGTTTIGRGMENDIVLSDSAVSRYHAQVEFDGSSCKVIDQNSSNGTFLADTRLLAGVGEVWNPQIPLRIGSSWLRLKLINQTLSGNTRSLAFQPSSISQDGLTGIALNPPQVQIEPGKSARLEVELKNLGVTVSHYRITLEGIPASWLSEIPEPIQLMPGEMKIASFTFHPPIHPKSRAGRHPFIIHVKNQGVGSDDVDLRSTLTITPYSRFTAQLHPQKVYSGAFAQVRIENQSNLPETYTLSFEDRGDEVAFAGYSPQITIAEGGHSDVRFSPRPRKKKWFGGNSSYPFEVKVDASKAEGKVLAGEVVDKALLPMWIIPLLLFLCFVLTAGTGIAAYAYLNGRPTEVVLLATATMAPSMTEDLRATQLGLTRTADSAEKTLNALRLENEQQETQQAGTQTAVLLAGLASATQQVILTQQAGLEFAIQTQNAEGTANSAFADQLSGTQTAQAFLLTQTEQALRLTQTIQENNLRLTQTEQARWITQTAEVIYQTTTAQAALAEPYKLSDNVIGGSGGADAFNDLEKLPASPVNVHVKQVIVCQGDFIDSVQIILESGPLDLHGGSGGFCQEFNLSLDEWIVSIEVLYDSYIGSFIFTTEKGKSARFGISGTISNIYRAPEGYAIVGFYGRSGSLVDSIGFILRRYKYP